MLYHVKGYLFHICPLSEFSKLTDQELNDTLYPMSYYISLEDYNKDPSNFSRYPHGRRYKQDEISDIEILSVRSYIDSEQEYLISCLPVVEEEIIHKNKAIVGETPAEITDKDLCVICQVNII